MKKCSLCGRQIQTDKYFSRTSSCPHCGGDLRICLNCTFYSATSHNKCREPRAEFQRVRDKANFCDYFSFREASSQSPEQDKSAALKALEDLFKKP